MTYAMMKTTTKLMPLMRHKRSQNTRVVYTLVDELMALVVSLMRIPSRTEGECGIPPLAADAIFQERRGGRITRWCRPIRWCRGREERVPYSTTSAGWYRRTTGAKVSWTDGRR